MATSPSSASNVWVFPIGSACFLEDVIPSFPYHPTFWYLSPSGNPLVSWCEPYRQGCPPLLSLWPESTLLCVSAQSQVWQRLLDVEGTSCCIAVWHLTPGHSPPQPSHSPIYFCGDMNEKRPDRRVCDRDQCDPGLLPDVHMRIKPHCCGFESRFSILTVHFKILFYE